MADALLKIFVAILVGAFAASWVPQLMGIISSGWRFGRCAVRDNRAELGYRDIYRTQNPLDFWTTLLGAYIVLPIVLTVLIGCGYLIWLAISAGR